MACGSGGRCLGDVGGRTERRRKSLKWGTLMRAIIAGGGIGGLAAAMALRQVGADVQVYESVPELKPLGVGINLLPHAMGVLAELGLVERILPLGVATRELAYFNKFGQAIWSEPRGRFAGYDQPQLSVHRGRLQMALLEAASERLADGAIHMDRELVAFQQDAAGVRATFVDASGATHGESGDVLIGADGIHSTLRAAFFPEEGPPAYSGRVLWRATTQAPPFLSGATMIMAGHRRQKFVAYPLTPPDSRGLATINWIAELPREAFLTRENWNRLGDVADFLPAFEDWRFDWLDVPALIRGASSIYQFPMVDRDPLPFWSRGRVTLLGDSAHPMYPIGSNGASQAILDARALADALANAADPADALARYQDVRLPATAAIVRANRADGPEQCMDIAEARAPNGFNDIAEVVSRAELEEIAARYKQVAGFAIARR